MKLVVVNNIVILYLGYVEFDIEFFGCVFYNVGFFVFKNINFSFV